MKTKYQFIHFEKVDGVWWCRNNKMGDELGTIEFYHPWKQWVFAPTGPSFYSVGCLNDIAHFISQLTVSCRKDEDMVPF